MSTNVSKVLVTALIAAVTIGVLMRNQTTAKLLTGAK